MKTLSKVLLTGTASLGAIAFNTMTASSASAITLVQTQTFNFGPTPTVWADVASVARYAPGGLVRVELELQGSAVTDLAATATTSAQAFILNGSSVGANIIASSGTVPAVNLTVIPTGAIPNTPVIIPGNSTVNLLDINGNATFTQTLTTGLSAFEGASPFSINLLAIGSSTLSTGGGNINVNQATEASSTLIVRYFIADAPPVGTPEPGTVLAVLAVAGAGALSRRKK